MPRRDTPEINREREQPSYGRSNLVLQSLAELPNFSSSIILILIILCMDILIFREDAYHRADSSSKKRRDSPAYVKQKNFHAKDLSPEEYSSEKLADDYSPASEGQAVYLENRKKEREEKR